MTFDQIKDECMRMQVGEQKSYTLQDIATLHQLRALLTASNIQRTDGLAISLRVSDLSLIVSCYKPRI